MLELEGLEYTAGAVAHWVNGTRNPRLQNPQLRQTLARVLRLSERELMMRAGYELARTGRSEAAQIAAEIIDNLPPDKQDLAVRLLEQLRAS